MAQEAYTKYRDSVISQLRSEGVDIEQEINQIQANYANLAGKNLSREDAMEEMAAKFTKRMMDDHGLFQKFISESEDNRTAGQKLVDSLKELVANVKALVTGKQRDQVLHDILGVTVDEANATLKAWNEMLTEAAKAKPSKATATTNKSTKYSIPMKVIQNIQSIGRKSVNQFTSADIQMTEAFAKQYWKEMTTKSPFFRAWFGDWRAYDTTQIQISNRKGSQRGVQHNTDTGWDIQVSSKVKSETIAHQSTASKMAIPYLDYIDDIVKHAILLDTYSIGEDNAKSINSLLMHYFYCVADIGNGAEIIKLDIEEMNDPNQFATRKRAYKLINIERWQPGANAQGQ